MDTQHHQQTQTPKPMLFIKLMSKRRTWATLFFLVYSILLYSSWNLLQTILTWYNNTTTTTTLSSPSSSSLSLLGARGPYRAAYAAVMLGAVFGVMSMVAALAVAVPAMLVTWITVLVLLAFFGKPRRDLVVEAKKLTAEIWGVVVKILIKEGNLVAAFCAVLGYFLLVRSDSDQT